jgi:uncharacterized protein YggE
MKRDMTSEFFTTITATGRAETFFKSVTFHAEIMATGKHNQEARDKVDMIYAALKKIITQLNMKGAGIDEKTMTCGYNVQPWTEYDRTTSTNTHKGYQVTATVTCSTKKVDSATMIMDAMTKIDGASVLSPIFTPDDSNSVRKDAFKAAYERAMEDFHLQCTVLGENPDLFSVVSYSPTALTFPDLREGRVMALAASGPAGAPPTEIKAGKAEITATISLNFVRKPPPARAKSAPKTGVAKEGNGKPGSYSVG